MAGNKNNLSFSFTDNFTCKICLEVLDDPVQCQNNEHYYCRKCITKHLRNSETCPLCIKQLTLETVRPPTRIVASVVSQLKKACCRHVSRGCEENVQVEELLLHEQTCGYAPVVCSNEGCKETVNRRDKESHETEECKFRKVTCEFCDEELVYVDYEKHNCTLRKEINEFKSRFDEVTETLNRILLTQGEMLEKLAAHDQSIKNLQDPLRRASSMTFQREATVVNGQIFIFGGYESKARKSFEVFNWSTKTWTLIENCLFFQRLYSFSFLYGNKIMLCGGRNTERIEYLNPNESGYTSTVASVSLPDNAQHSGLLYEGRILTFYKGVVETSLESPGESRTLLTEVGPREYFADLRHGLQNVRPDGFRSVRAGVHCFGNNIYIVGGKAGSVEKYDVVKNEMKTLPSLPYNVSNMATVAYKDNIIILGGQDGNCIPLNNVLMYNIHSMEWKRLPSMLEKRSCCTAVIVGDVVVVMGGEKGGSELNTVEYYVMGARAWKELPAMNLPRAAATACVYV